MIDVRNPQCTRCALHETTSRICVGGKGNAKGRILLVGEAPGANEEKTGEIFSGASGQLLALGLKTLGMTDDCYITNTAKCRPPRNRPPKPEEIQACQMYLWREIDILRPKIIVALGRIASITFGLKTQRLEGLVYRVRIVDQYYPVLLTTHPAYCLRMGKKATLALRHHLEIAKEYVKL